MGRRVWVYRRPLRFHLSNGSRRRISRLLSARHVGGAARRGYPITSRRRPLAHAPIPSLTKGWGGGVALDAAVGPEQARGWLALFGLLAAGVLFGPLALRWSQRQAHS